MYVARCVRRTKEIKEQVPINLFFDQSKKRPAAAIEDDPKKRTNLGHEIPCLGINDQTWPRPRAIHAIIDCITCSPSILHGGPSRHVLCQNLFGSSAEDSLTCEQIKTLDSEMKERATWRIERQGTTKSIFSTGCMLMIPRTFRYGKPVVVCKSCDQLRSDRTLISAINTAYAAGDTIKYTRKDYMADDIFQARRLRFTELDVLATSLVSATKEGDREFWKAFCTHAQTGVFNHLEAFTGLLKAVSIRTEREAHGKKTTGMMFQETFDNFVMTLTAMSPKAAKLFTDNFAGRSARSQRQIRRTTGMQLQDGLCVENFTKICEHLSHIGYKGPVCVGSDQTVCVKSLRIHNQAIVGAQGGDVRFEDEADLTKKCKEIIDSDNLCSKLRCYDVSIYWFTSD